jgi:hypothetical protein
MKFLVASSLLAVAVSGAALNGRNLLTVPNADMQVIQDLAHACNSVYSDPCTSDYNYGAGWTCNTAWEIPHGYDHGMGNPKLRVAFLKKDDDSSTCGFVFRGTDSNYEFETSLDFLFDGKLPLEHVLVAAGYKKLFQKVLDDGNFKQKLNDDSCNGTVYLAGHSMGGGLATLANVYLDKVNKTDNGLSYGAVKSITFGAPKVVQGGGDYNDLRVFHKWDLAAANGLYTLSALGYEHAGRSLEYKCAPDNYFHWPHTSTGYDVCRGHTDVSAHSHHGTTDEAEGSADPGYHSMDSYVDWVHTAPTPAPTTPAPTVPLLTSGASCDPGWTSQCASGWCDWHTNWCECGWWCPDYPCGSYYQCR